MNKSQLSLYYGSIAGLILFAISYFFHQNTMESFQNMNRISMIVLLGAIAYVGLELDNYSEFKFKIKDGFKIGFLVSLAVGLFDGTFYFYYFEKVNPELLTTFKVYNISILKQLKFTPSYEAKMINLTNNLITPKFMFISTLVSVIFQGLFYSPLISIFLKFRQKSSSNGNNSF